jgi:hypothetical protein
MTWSRRAILRSAAGLSLLGLAGCASDGVDYSIADGTATATAPPAETPQPTENTPVATPEPTETPAETDTQTATPTNESPLARATGTVFDEIEWFATEYPVVVQRGLSTAGRIEDTLVKLRRSPALSESDLRRIEDSTEAYYDFLYGAVAPHFPTNRVDDIVRRSRERVATIRRFSERGDSDRAERAVSSLSTLYSRWSTRSIFERRFPDFPAGPPLVDYLTDDGYSASTPLVFVVSYPSETYTTVARADGPWEIRSRLASGITDRELQGYFRRAATLFGGVDTDTGRTGRVFLNVHLRTDSIRHLPVYLQRFGSTRRAEDVYSSLVGSSVFLEGSEDIGRTALQRAFYYQEIPVEYPRDGYLVYDSDGNVVYDEDGDITRDTDRTIRFQEGGDRNPDEQGDIVYTYLATAGRYLIAAAPSLTAWEERPAGTNDPLRNTWLANTPTS